MGETSRGGLGLDLELAYLRVRDELRDQPKTGRALAQNSFELELIEVDREGWLAEVANKLEKGSFVPGPADVVDAPKGRGLVRPGVRLGIEDRVVFTAAVGACLDKIDAATRWSQGGQDLSTRLDPSKLHRREWMRSPFKGWFEWHERSLQRVDAADTDTVLTADIAGYFENINLGLLRSDLNRIGCDKAVVGLISSCLNSWAQCPDRGLPQGVMASDILAKLYLEPLDRRLRDRGYSHMRYTDDIRIFARSREEALRALVEITKILRARGLTLQSSKTLIRSPEEARQEFDGVIPAIEQVRDGYVSEIVQAGLMDSDVSFPMAEMDDLAKGNIAPEVLRRAFTRYVVEEASPNKSMLNFLLRRLGTQGDCFAVATCASLLNTHPEFTYTVARYFDDLGFDSEIEEAVDKAMRHVTSATYPFQRYQLLWWLREATDEIGESLLSVVRQLATSEASPEYVRSVAVEVLGHFGGHSDMEEIEALYKKVTGELNRAQLLSCLKRLEKGRRNSIAARVSSDPGWLGRAAKLVRA